jgi:hypothetical protein
MVKEIRTLENRVRVWTGTVHYADLAGRPACGSAKRTSSAWMEFTVDTVTCRKCQRQYGFDGSREA